MTRSRWLRQRPNTLAQSKGLTGTLVAQLNLRNVSWESMALVL